MKLGEFIQTKTPPAINGSVTEEQAKKAGLVFDNPLKDRVLTRPEMVKLSGLHNDYVSISPDYRVRWDWKIDAEACEVIYTPMYKFEGNDQREEGKEMIAALAQLIDIKPVRVQLPERVVQISLPRSIEVSRCDRPEDIFQLEYTNPIWFFETQARKMIENFRQAQTLLVKGLDDLLTAAEGKCNQTLN